MISLNRMKNFLLAKGMESVIPFLSDHSPATLIKMIERLRVEGLKRMRAAHRGSAADLERRVEAAHAFFEMAKRKMNHLSPQTQRKLAFNAFFNAVNLGEEKREEYKKKHGEYPPFFLLMSPSMACDLRCFGCYAWKHPKEKALSRQKVSDIIREAKEEMGIYFISLTGGEPTYWPHLEEIVQEHDDVMFQVYTHGQRIDDAMAKRFAEYGNIYPAISIEGSEPFTDARRGQGAYKRILESMDRLTKYGALFGFSITHTRINHESVISGDFIDTLVNHGAAFGWYFQYIPIGREPQWELVPTAEQRLERREVVLNMRKEKPVLVYDFWNDGDSCEGCIAWGRKYVHISAQGLVEPCVFVHFAVDSIHEKSLGECLRSPCFKAARAKQPFDPDLRRPCPQIDHPEALKELAEKFGLRGTHDGAEDIIGAHFNQVAASAEEYRQLLAQNDAAGQSAPTALAAEGAGE